MAPGWGQTLGTPASVSPGPGERDERDRSAGARVPRCPCGIRGAGPKIGKIGEKKRGQGRAVGS